MKAVSGKFHPIHQWFYFDSAESLPEVKPGSLDVAPRVSTCLQTQHCTDVLREAEAGFLEVVHNREGCMVPNPV